MNKEKLNNSSSPADEINERLQGLEEKFEYQDQTIDALNDVVIEQQNQLDRLFDQLEKLETLLTAIQDSGDEGEEPPPPHY